jgi:hypothetical protein
VISFKRILPSVLLTIGLVVANAAEAVSTGILNTYYGIGALYSNTTGSSNTANGNSALYWNTTGSSNTAYPRD